MALQPPLRGQVEQVAPGACATGFTHVGDMVEVTADAPRPGDFILTHGDEWTSKLIRFGQSLRYRGASAKYTYWNHTALVVDGAGTIVEAHAVVGERSLRTCPP